MVITNIPATPLNDVHPGGYFIVRYAEAGLQQTE